MGLRTGTLVLAISLFNAGLVHAATLSNVQGMVLVDSGEGFRQVTSPVPLPLGSRVTVRVGSSAAVAYEDGCNVPVSVGAIVSVAARSPCAALGSERQSLGGPNVDPTLSQPTMQLQPPTPTAPGFWPVPPTVPWQGVLVGGVIIAGSVSAAVMASRQQAGPASP